MIVNIRRFIPIGRTVAFALTGFTAGMFVFLGMAALASGYVLPDDLRLGATYISYTGLLAIAALLLVERRKRARPATERDRAAR